MKTPRKTFAWAWALATVAASLGAAELPKAESSFRFTLPPAPFATNLIADSPFGLNTALRPDAPDLEARLRAMQELGVKWARQDFVWRRIERMPGEYRWEAHDELVRKLRAHGIQILGCLAYAPTFHDPRTSEGVDAYVKFVQAAAKHYAGLVDTWQVWNEPNGGFWDGTPDDYARLLAAAGPAIHGANGEAKVVGLNMAFCDVLWAGRIVKQVPYGAFDIVAFHPYRPPNAPEDKFDWWTLDQYVKVWHRGELPTNYALVNMTFLDQTQELVKLMQQFGPPKPIWITEICWNSHLHPYGTSELRQADLAVRFYTLAMASPAIQKVFWWTLADQGDRQFDQADMVGLARADLSPKYAYAAYGWMTRLLEGKQWVRNDAFGPDVFAVVFNDAAKKEDVMVAWTTRPFAYLRVNNTERGLTFHDVLGTRRFVEFDPIRTGSLTVPLSESPIYITAPEGLKATVKPDPGW